MADGVSEFKVQEFNVQWFNVSMAALFDMFRRLNGLAVLSFSP